MPRLYSRFADPVVAEIARVGVWRLWPAGAAMTFEVLPDLPLAYSSAGVQGWPVGPSLQGAFGDADTGWRPEWTARLHAERDQTQVRRVSVFRTSRVDRGDQGRFEAQHRMMTELDGDGPRSTTCGRC